MPVDALIPLQAKLPDNMGNLASIMNTANTMLSAKRQGVAYQQEQGALNARKAVASVISDPKYRDPATGLINMDAIAPAIVQADPMNYVASDAISSMAKFNNDLITVKKSALGLSDAARSTVASAIGSYANDPTVTRDKVEAGLDDLVAQAPVTKPIVDVWKRHLDAMPDDPKAIQSFAINARGQVMPASTQAQVQTPSGVAVSNGQQNTVVNTNPNAAMPVGAPIPGTTVQQQLPPTTPVFNNATNQPGYLGPQTAAGAPGAAPAPSGGAAPMPAGAPASAGPETQIPPAEQGMRDQYRLKILLNERAKEANNPDATARAQNLAAIDKEIASVQGEKPVAPTPARSGFVASGPPLGTAENISGTVKTVNDDWDATVKNAATASQDIGVLENIKQYAHGAAMGVMSDRIAYLSGLAKVLHLDPNHLDDVKTNTDLLEKNSSMLTLKGGVTDLAKTIAEMANPNHHMNEDAAIEAANQVLAQRKLAAFKQQYMQHFKGNADQYSEELATFNKIADPRILQLPDMSRDEKARMLSAMTDQQRRDFINNTRKMQAIGALQ